MANSETRVSVVHRAQEPKAYTVVIFQKNYAALGGDLTVAWLVRRLGAFESLSFNFPTEVEVSAADSFGNETARLPAARGQAFEVVQSGSGNTLQVAARPAASGSLIEVHNVLGKGSISVQIYRNGDLLGAKTGIAPSQHADFAFSDSIFIGIAEDAVQGQVIDPAAVQAISPEIHLDGLRNVEITLTGGGSGSGATSLQFVISHSS